MASRLLIVKSNQSDRIIAAAKYYERSPYESEETQHKARVLIAQLEHLREHHKQISKYQDAKYPCVHLFASAQKALNMILSQHYNYIFAENLIPKEHTINSIIGHQSDAAT